MQDLESEFPVAFTCFSTSRLNSALYRRLPRQLLRLSVLKLDGSRFEVEVSKTATVAQLKAAVEQIFSRRPHEDQHIDISWSHVWNHFCLCYRGQKLVNNKAYIRLYGIKDDDQLNFIQHQSSITSSDKRSYDHRFMDGL